MEVKSLPEALLSIKEQRGCSQNQLARDMGIAKSWVTDVLHGRVTSTGLAKVMKLLDRVGWEVCFRPKREESDPVKRREFVAAAASVAFIPTPEGPPFGDPPYLRELAVRIERDRREQGGIASMPAAMRYVQGVRRLVEGRDRQAQAAASNVTAAAVWTLEDAGRFDLGDSVGRLALELARRSGDTDAQSQALSALTRIQIHRGDAGEAIRYALQAVRLREVPEAQRNFLTLRLGEALNIAPGQQRAAREVVDGLQATLADVWARAPYEAAHQLSGAGQVLYDLGAYQEAQACLDEAMRLGPSPLTTALALARQCKIALRTRRTDLAAEQMLCLARVAPLVHSARLNRYLTEVLAMSAPWQAVPEVREAREQLQSVLPTPAPSSKR